MGEEHFCNSHQAWGCSAAPIFTPFGQLWGCFDISGPTQADHSQALWLAIGAAREIERLLLNASLSNMGRSYFTFSNLATKKAAHR